MAIKISGTTVIDDSRNITDAGRVTIGSGQPFWGNKKLITTNTTLNDTYNHMSIGPVTISDGVSLTIDNNARYVVI